MNIEIKLFFDLVKYLPSGTSNNRANISVNAGTTVQNLIDILGIPSEIQKTILINGIKAGNETEIHENDSIAIFPPMAGG
jgi:molybdopterin converting factor small subunit